MRRPAGTALAVRAYCWLSDRAYNEFAWAFGFLTRLFTAGRFSEWRRIALRYLPEDQVLDLGCGSGDLLTEMSPRGPTLVGIDISSGMALAFRRKARRNPGRVSFVRASAHNLPFHASCFRAVVTTFPTRFLSDPSVLEEVARVLQPRGHDARLMTGRLVIVGLFLVSDSPIAKALLAALYGAPYPALMAHFTWMADKAGFELVAIDHFQGVVRPSIYVAEALPGRSASLQNQEETHGNEFL